MSRVTDAFAPGSGRPPFMCDFSPPKGGRAELLTEAAALEADFICVAYNPGKSVRLDSVTAAFEIGRATGRGVVFNLAPRDMNKLAIESRLLGAELLGLRNVLVVQGDALNERDGVTAVPDYSATGLIAAIRRLNSGLDHRGSKLRAPCGFCIGASIDLGRGLHKEAKLTRRKAEAGAEFFVTQPVFEASAVAAFLDAYHAVSGAPLAQPVFWGLQILARDGVVFSDVPDGVQRDLAKGRDGVEIALEAYERLREAGVRAVYLVAPILRGGARDYGAAARLLRQLRG